MIEALAALCRQQGTGLDRIAAIRLRTSPRWLSVCDIKAPRSGLEVKFSYVWLAGMVVSGLSTASDRAYTDALASDPVLAAFAGRVEVQGDPTVGDMQARGEVVLTDGRSLAFFHDLDAPIPSETLAHSLQVKAQGLIGADSTRLWHLLATLDDRSARDIGAAVRGGR